jgi:hypothetical protein
LTQQTSWPQSQVERAVVVLRDHRAIAVVALGGVSLRVAAAVAYGPALFWTDSWAYVEAAHDPAAQLVLRDKPSGYPIVLDVLDVVTRHLAFVTTLQHVAGIVVGVLVYVLAIRCGCRRWVAAIAAACVLLDPAAIALEQRILTEAFFSLTLFAAAYATIVGRDRTRSLVLAGVLIAFSITIRYQALLIAPVWALYVLLATPNRRRIWAAGVALLLPLLAYGAWHRSVSHRWLSEMDGWLLYGRVAELADCDLIEPPERWRSLCGDPRIRRADSVDTVDFYLWEERSPARVRFGDPYDLSRERLATADRELRAFSLFVIRERPLAFARLVASELARFVVPGGPSDHRRSYDAPIRFPSRAEPLQAVQAQRRDAYYPDYEPAVRSPARMLRAYQAVARLPHWLVILVAALAGLAALAGGGRLWGADKQRRADVLLLCGMGFVLLLASAASHFELRYMVPALPLFVTADALALTTLRRGYRSRSRPSG